MSRLRLKNVALLVLLLLLNMNLVASAEQRLVLLPRVPPAVSDAFESDFGWYLAELDRQGVVYQISWFRPPVLTLTSFAASAPMSYGWATSLVFDLPEFPSGKPSEGCLRELPDGQPQGPTLALGFGKTRTEAKADAATTTKNPEVLSALRELEDIG